MELQTAERNESGAKKRTAFTKIAEYISARSPNLKEDLKMADMKETPLEFLEKLVRTAITMSAGIIVLEAIVIYNFLLSLAKTNVMLLAIIVLLTIFATPLIIYNYLMLYPKAIAAKRQKEIDYEVIFAGRHIAIALKSGMPLFESFVGASKGYGAVSKEIERIVDKVVLGVPINHAIRETTQNTPSLYFTRVMMQVANSISSGADIGNALEGVLDQISREQLIGLREYSQKLTPFVMFYMVLGIVVPSLGIVMTTVILSTISGSRAPISLLELITVAMVIGILQYLFVGFIESSRPRYLTGA
ncbi:type II secretion system F family protein [Candidatus Micrarchaeota archaeon]|nr:type II secretion system F family protein [Candidatus Micrarchaeota archaeon]